MFKCLAEYYTDIEPITYLYVRAFTKKGAYKKAFKKVNYVNALECGKVGWIEVRFKDRKYKRRVEI